MTKRKKGDQQLSREKWLKDALKELAKDGQAGLRIQGLADALGVSRGSFYWHFRNRDDFVHAILDYWFEEYTRAAVSAVELQGGSAEERLAQIIRVVHDRNRTRYDLAIRSWAINDPTIARSVRKTDRFRLTFLKSLFAEMGFTGNDMEIRARTCLAFMTLENSMFDKMDHKHRADLIDNLHEFLVRK